MKLSTLALAFSLLTLPAHAALISKEAVVRVQSGRCHNPSGLHMGSGLIFNRKGKAYVLTSEHVLLHGTKGLCHTISGKAWPETKAELLAVDWGNGLALLGLGEASIKGSADYQALIPTKIDENDAAVVSGFPHSYNELITNDKGYVLIPATRRHLLPSITSVVHIAGSHGEFGMSGGPVLSADRLHVLGVLSHQYIEQQAARRSAVREYSRDNPNIQSHLIAISMETAFPWLETYFAAPESFLADFVRDPETQLSRTDAIYTADLRFDFTGIAGATHPIGGPDGVGSLQRPSSELRMVGGVDEESPVFSKGVIQVSSDPLRRRTKWYLPLKSSWLKELRKDAEILSHKVEIRYFLHRHPQTGKIQGRAHFGSLAEFFNLLAHPDFEPVKRKLAQVDERENLVRLRLKAEQTGLMVAELKQINGGGDAKELLEKIELVIDLLGSTDWDLVQAADVGELLSSEEEGWKAIFGGRNQALFTKGVELHRLVRELEQLILKN